MSNTFGRSFRCTTWGESHGGGVGVVIDGCPPRIPVSVEEVQAELDRRRPGQSELTTPRDEADRVQILSGLFEGQTLGTPISMMVWNKDAQSSAYAPFKNGYRPSHADYTYEAKYGIRNWMGGGRASARETIGRVAAAVVARKALQAQFPIEVVGWVSQVHTLDSAVDPDMVTRQEVEKSQVRCPDPEASAVMRERILEMKEAGDSVGGVVMAVARGVPPGLGEPVFGKLEADLAGAMLSLPAVKGFEVGSGFSGTRLRGSEHNDAFVMRGGQVRTETNRSGGIQGGISNGESIVIRVAFKPTATIFKAQPSVNEEGQEVTLEARGRHDPCVLPRAVPIVEAMMWLVLADQWLRQRGQCGGA